ncbi:hypothetical protein QBC32DRAFT_255691 [Pseudoneurospora amorphoporcata]|uniref:Uncharacterized protein n=1 Tax=Pseudoneurospora amorphoporcata TaxID=241081 RepID=A0AAN6P0L0_9PEZI|nr:hypothetical protein QBC32DRAFT_255691 [Pseudoneurospora amorphoporcata]
MEAMASIPNPNSKTCHPSHFPMFQPVPASALLSQDARISRLRGHSYNGLFSTGCRELDSHVLLGGGTGAAAEAAAEGGAGGFEGGFEPGCVVGISSEEESIGLGIGLQVVARMLLLASAPSAAGKAKPEAKAKAMIITTLSTTSLLPRLRLALVSEARVLLQGNGNAQQVEREEIKSCLERVLVARVFDAEGLREVLRELEEDTSSSNKQKTATDMLGSSSADKSAGTERGRGGAGQEQKADSNASPLPSLILITDTSYLLNTLFARNKTGSDRFAAHNSAVQLSDQIRGLSRRGPLVMLLNSTISPVSSNSTSSMFDDDNNNNNNNNRGPKQPDLSIMRSIFNPPPPAPMEGAVGVMTGLVGQQQQPAGVAPASYRGGGGHGGYGNHFQQQHQTQPQMATAAAAAASRRNKPSYGMVFSQMLDLHLLCTRVPRGRSRQRGGAYGGGYGGYVWAVEVLLDELGVYEGLEGVLGETGEGEGKRKGLTRRSREQRWGAVEIEKGSGRVVDAFR